MGSINFPKGVMMKDIDDVNIDDVNHEPNFHMLAYVIARVIQITMLWAAMWNYNHQLYLMTAIFLMLFYLPPYNQKVIELVEVKNHEKV